MIPRTLKVVIEWRPSKNRISVRGCWPQEKFRPPPLLEPDNQQNCVGVFEGVDMKDEVGFSNVDISNEPLAQTPRPWQVVGVDALPKQDEMVLVTVQMNSGTRYRRTAVWQGECGWSVDKPLAWCKLPESWQGEV